MIFYLIVINKIIARVLYYPILNGKILHVTHPFATKNFVRLACVKHITSVHSEPGSNSY